MQRDNMSILHFIAENFAPLFISTVILLALGIWFWVVGRTVENYANDRLADLTPELRPDVQEAIDLSPLYPPVDPEIF
jgi:hypothetical protein